jgi:hypothetical protein
VQSVPGKTLNDLGVFFPIGKFQLQSNNHSHIIELGKAYPIGHHGVHLFNREGGGLQESKNISSSLIADQPNIPKEREYEVQMVRRM